jgi:hypothetical protein
MRIVAAALAAVHRVCDSGCAVRSTAGEGFADFVCSGACAGISCCCMSAVLRCSLGVGVGVATAPTALLCVVCVLYEDLLCSSLVYQKVELHACSLVLRSELQPDDVVLAVHKIVAAGLRSVCSLAVLACLPGRFSRVASLNLWGLDGLWSARLLIVAKQLQLLLPCLAAGHVSGRG